MALAGKQVEMTSHWWARHDLSCLPNHLLCQLRFFGVFVYAFYESSYVYRWPDFYRKYETAPLAKGMRHLVDYSADDHRFVDCIKVKTNFISWKPSCILLFTVTGPVSVKVVYRMPVVGC